MGYYYKIINIVQHIHAFLQESDFFAWASIILT